MTRKLAVLWTVVVAVVALAGAHTPAAGDAHGNLTAFHDRPAASQLPTGFILPSSDVDVNVSSVVAADLDADGDLDIVASNGSGESLGILVWVNDGAGRLTRRLPAQPKTVRSEAPSPSLEERQAAVGAPIQPDSPAVAASCENTWLTPLEQSCRRPRAPDAESATPATLRSRAPPALS